MSQRSLPQRYHLLKFGGFAAAVLVGASQLWAQTDAATTTPTQTSEQSVMLPPPNPPQSGATNQAQPTKEAFLQPSGPVTEQAQERQLPVPPQQPQPGTRPMGRAQLGVFLVPTDGAGVRVSSVTAGTAAEAAGLKPGDIVLAVNGQPAMNPQEVIGRIREMQVGDAVELRVWRNGQEQTFTATLQEMRPVQMQTNYSVPAGGYIEGGVVQPYYYYSGRPVYRRYYEYYPGTVYSPYGNYGYGYGYPYGAYYGTPRIGYYNSPWGQGVRVGPFGFGWR